MSSFICEHCNTEILDSPKGYTTECEHWQIEKPNVLPAWVAAGRVMDYFTVEDHQEGVK